MNKERIKWRRWGQIQDTKRQIKHQLLRPGDSYEDSIEDLEWWVEKMEGLYEQSRN